MRTTKHRYNWLIRTALKVTKYASLTLFGITVICLILIAFGATPLIDAFMQRLLPWIARVGLVIFCLAASGAIAESLR